MLDTARSQRIKATFLKALAAADDVADPYPHWHLDATIPDDVVDAIVALPFAPPEDAVFDGRREANNQTRVFFGKELQKEHPVAADLAAALGDEEVVAALEKTCDVDLSKGQLRIEYCLDTDGFWLEPHTDIAVKQFTMLIYLSGEPELADAGTDVYDTDMNLVATSPYGKGIGFIFIPSETSWHGFRKRPINGIRRSLIVNFVAPEWRSVEELA
ncbi:2OG-Fe(II) oxygenase [Rhodobium gokarnense]|uniref:2OG-Fe(II) oxygenase n=1 Tax=Rhodobium gokarnense TaxID=364296 RepID=A0ABT3HEK4_9HYPH|nr:2OG-Fe(II) oxygenase [Rhodobium gokarnense]MCW2308827.1 hypothetical protein [Rhodobium gokarnense]